MGQALSSNPQTQPHARSGSFSSRTYPIRPSVRDHVTSEPTSRPTNWRRRSSRMVMSSINSTRSAFSSALNTPDDSDDMLSDLPRNPNRRSRLLRRAQTSITSIPSALRRRTAEERARDSTSSLLISTSQQLEPAPTTTLPTRPSLRHSMSAPTDLDILRSHSPDHESEQMDSATQDLSALSRRRSNMRPSSLIADRWPSFRADRVARTLSNPLRRRRPTSRTDDQIPVLSQLLSAAAAATAASLMGDDPNAVRNARGIGGDESTLESFLESLQNGRMASTLNRSAGSREGGDDGNGVQGINFVRLFRFGSATNGSTGANAPRDGGGQTGASDSGGNSSAQDDEPGPEGRMVPIIIVGIRSINPTAGQDEHGIPSLFDALTGFPDAPPPAEPPVDTTRPPPNSLSRFSHRRRASMGGANGYDTPRSDGIPRLMVVTSRLE